jgi:hypothetical protein
MPNAGQSRGQRVGVQEPMRIRREFENNWIMLNGGGKIQGVWW